jgi:hypothetical protein
MKPYFKLSKDTTKQFNETINRFRNDKVLVGIPVEDNGRKPEHGETQPIGNAALLALTNFGSAVGNIPAWPVMSLGIHAAQDSIAEQFKICAQQVLSSLKNGTSSLSALDVYYNRAGIIASNSIKKVINAQDGAPALSPHTLAARKAQGFKGEKRGIVTGQMRNAITYIVRGG